MAFSEKNPIRRCCEVDCGEIMGTLFATICDYSSLFATVHLLATIRRCSLFAVRNYLLIEFSRHQTDTLKRTAGALSVRTAETETKDFF